MSDPAIRLLLIGDVTERALEFVRANRYQRARELAHGLCQATRDFSQRETPVDDTTVIVIKVDPVP